jgi:hypothetical protein
MRFWVRLGRQPKVCWIFKGHCECTKLRAEAYSLANLSPFSPYNTIQMAIVVEQQRKRCLGLTLANQFALCHHTSATK